MVTPSQAAVEYPGGGLSTNYDWAALVLHDGGWPASGNNITVVTQWMCSEEPPTGWWNRDNPLNNGLGSGGGSGLGSYPTLIAAAYYVAANLQSGYAGYPAVAADLAASAPSGTTARAIWNSSWASSHYGQGSSWCGYTIPKVAAPSWAWGPQPTAAALPRENLLESASFGDGSTQGWNLTPHAAWATYRNSTGYDGAAYYLEMNTGSAGRGASVWQDVAYKTSPGQSYSFSAWVRSASGAAASACLVLWGLGGQQESAVDCTTLHTSAWTLLTAPLDTHLSSHGALRAQIYMETPGLNYDVDTTALVHAGLTSASFGEGNRGGWNLSPHAAWATYRNGTSYQGASYYLEMNTGSGGVPGSLWQDVVVNTTPGQSYSVSAWMRSPSGTHAEVCLVLWGLGGRQESAEDCTTLTGTPWTLLTAPLDTHVSAHSVLRAQIYMYTAGVNYDVDATQLVQTGLQSASFGQGSRAGWNLSSGAAWADYHNATSYGGAAYYLEMNAGNAGSGASVWQDITARTAPGESYSFSAWMRSPSGASANVCLVLWGLGGRQESAADCTTLRSDTWTLLTAPLDTHLSAHDGLRAQIYMDTTGVNYDVDATSLVVGVAQPSRSR